MKPNKRGSKCAHKSESEFFVSSTWKVSWEEEIITASQRSCRKVKFSQVCVCPQVGCMSGPRPLPGGGYVWSQVPLKGTTTGRYTPGKVHNLEGTPLGTDIYWWPPKRVVRILQECILVGHLNSESSNMNLFIFHDDNFHFLGGVVKWKIIDLSFRL